MDTDRCSDSDCHRNRNDYRPSKWDSHTNLDAGIHSHANKNKNTFWLLRLLMKVEEQY